jgi:Ca2+-binding EF-hand superfamily protein
MCAQLLDPKEMGFLTLESFHDVVSSSGEQLSDEEIELMFKDADVDGDGKVHPS